VAWWRRDWVAKDLARNILALLVRWGEVAWTLYCVGQVWEWRKGGRKGELECEVVRHPWVAAGRGREWEWWCVPWWACVGK